VEIAPAIARLATPALGSPKSEASTPAAKTTSAHASPISQM
jgi:hypothetical protein